MGHVHLFSARELEARRPFLTKQLETYFETAKVAGRLVNLDTATPEWQAAHDKFYRLRWSEMEIVGNPAIRQAMRRVQYALVDGEQAKWDAASQHALRWMKII